MTRQHCKSTEEQMVTMQRLFLIAKKVFLNNIHFIFCWPKAICIPHPTYFVLLPTPTISTLYSLFRFLNYFFFFFFKFLSFLFVSNSEFFFSFIRGPTRADSDVARPSSSTFRFCHADRPTEEGDWVSHTFLVFLLQQQQLLLSYYNRVSSGWMGEGESEK